MCHSVNVHDHEPQLDVGMLGQKPLNDDDLYPILSRTAPFLVLGQLDECSEDLDRVLSPS